MNVRELLGVPESVDALDRISVPLQQRVGGILDNGPAAGLLRGSWLGHPVHPMAVTVPVGAWTAAVVLETVLRDHRAARRLIGLGLAGAPLAVATGWADWAVRDDTDRRAGLVHAVGNTMAASAMLVSFRLRKRGPSVRAEAWSWAGLAAAAASGALGGHIAFASTPEP
ncbi:DUF2231 domain-containing protein [Rhodococcus maanshanensis]|uniref:Uncharacterized membrane protein n=1 Tax=Rhodococcus maanshanensis TaxID=183556 RepID=A0A1H7LRD9_9NOCA|nr:DUF2231 domain-containing protein [Rhodococcus maanshanensis]SEL01025.1 Uncharacterized membrane protein [Rhodococcus maanshanensis]